MKNELHTNTTSATVAHDIDPAELWLDQDITGEELIELDPLEETCDLLALANPREPADRYLQELPSRQFTASQEVALWRALMAEFRAQRGSGETSVEFVTRLKGSV